jgi:hypothetical protein
MNVRLPVPTVRVIHWKEEEAQPLLKACRGAGFDVEYQAGDGGAITRAIRTKPPEVLVIDLSRLPSHGREVVFANGDAEKVDGVRERLPDATYSETGKVAAAIKRLAKSAPKRNLAMPPAMMERSGKKSAVEKLGIIAGATVAIAEPPRDFPELLGTLPGKVEFAEDDAPLTLWFVHDRESLLNNLREIRAATARTKLWLLWRNGAKGEALTQNALRETAREVGLVDYKICAVDDRWSAMLFARKKA